MDNSMQWNTFFLTPSTTPTDASFSPAALQTPRTDSHFSGAYSPFVHPDSTNSTPYTSVEAIAHDRKSSTSGMLAARPLHDHNGHDASALSDNQHQHHHQQAHQFAFHNLQQSVAIQTPPPDTHQAKKRRQSRPHSIMFGTPSSMDQFGPQSLVDFADHSMLLQPANQPLMPFAMDFSQSVQAPQDQHMWDYGNGMSMDTLNQGMHPNAGLADPFTYQVNDSNSQGQVMASNTHAEFLATTPQLFTPFQPSPAQRAPTTAAAFPQRSLTSIMPLSQVPNMMSSTGMVDPTILYSSPSRPLPQAILPTSQAPTTRHPHADSVSPEKTPQRGLPSAAASFASSQLSFEASRDVQRPPSSSGGVPKSGLHRSLTIESRRPHSMYGSIDSLSRSNTTTSGPARRASPLKRYNRNSTTSLASICEIAAPALTRSHTSVVLTVDRKGRARAETRTVEPSPSKHMLTRYPELFAESDSDDSGSDATHSSAGGRQLRTTRADKVSSALASLEGLHLPARSSSLSSARVSPSKAAVAAAAQLRRQNSSKRKAHHRRSVAGSVTDVDSAMDTDNVPPNGSADSDDDATGGDAAAALRKLMERRQQQQQQQQASRSRPQSSAGRPSLQSVPGAFPPRSSSLFDLSSASSSCAQQSRQFFGHAPNGGQLGFGHGHSMSFSHSSDGFSGTGGAATGLPQSRSFHHLPMAQSQGCGGPSSPQRVMVGQVKPTGSVADAMSSITRCVCHLPIAEGQLMIQCDSCQLWLHAGCLGFSPTQLPTSYCCEFCVPGGGHNGAGNRAGLVHPAATAY